MSARFAREHDRYRTLAHVAIFDGGEHLRILWQQLLYFGIRCLWLALDVDRAK